MTRRVGLILLFVMPLGWLVQAQEPAKPTAPKSAETTDPASDNPSSKQQSIANRYRDLEGILLRISQKLERVGGAENRERAQLIQKALQEAKAKQISVNLEQLSVLLKEPKLKELKEVVEKGTLAEADLRRLLAILLNEEGKENIEFLKQLLAELKAAIQLQAVAKARNQSPNVEKADAKNSQDKATEAVNKILEKIKNREKKQEEAKNADKPDDKNKAQGKPGEGDNKNQQKGQGEKGEGENKPKGKGQEGEGQQGQQGKPGEQGEEQEQTPGRKRIQDANQDQRRAEDKIDKNDRQNAGDDQAEAKRKLEEAKKKLEEILRQLREEEIERILADLRRRCEKMLAMQERVYEDTKRIDQKVAASSSKKASREEEIDSRNLSDEENKIVHEADAAIELLKTEGTAVAFPEVFEQVRNDMVHVAKRLYRVDVAAETQAIEQDIIATLKEMIEALKKAQRDQENRRNNPSQQQQQNANQNLIDLIAELKMIKAMQVRVHNRTVLWGKRYQGEQAQVPEIITELKDLALRQLRIYDVTNNIAKGKNQ